MEQEEELSEVPVVPSSENPPLPAPVNITTTNELNELPTSDGSITVARVPEELVDETLDSSAPLFSTQDGDSSLNLADTQCSDNFSTQTQANIRDMAGNFTPTPATQTRKIQSNYKFRKRSHLN